MEGGEGAAGAESVERGEGAVKLSTGVLTAESGYGGESAQGLRSFAGAVRFCGWSWCAGSLCLLFGGWESCRRCRGGGRVGDGELSGADEAVCVGVGEENKVLFGGEGAEVAGFEVAREGFFEVGVVSSRKPRWPMRRKWLRSLRWGICWRFEAECGRRGV